MSIAIIRFFVRLVPIQVKPISSTPLNLLKHFMCFLNDFFSANQMSFGQMVFNQIAQNQQVLLNNCSTNKKFGMTSHVFTVKKWRHLGTMFLNFLQLCFMNFCNTLECLSLASIMFFGKAGAYPSEAHFKCSAWLINTFLCAALLMFLAPTK